MVVYFKYMLHFIYRLSVVILLVHFVSACDTNTKKPPSDAPISQEKPSPVHITAPEFEADSAYAYVQYQAELGPRVPGSQAHEKCLNYMRNQFTKYGATVQVQEAVATTFDNKKWKIQNLIASYQPENPSRILLCAHWDSRPFCDRDSIPANRKKACPGVNDGASGVGVLMETARLIQKTKPNVGIDIILFDLEDYGQPNDDETYPSMENSWCLGSQYWAKNPHKPGYFAKYGILLDMVGHKNATFPKEGVSVYFASSVVDKVWASAVQLGYGNYFINEKKGETTDDHAYINSIAQIPCIDILGFDMPRNDFFIHHHRLSDDLRQIDPATLKAVGQTLLDVIYNEQQ